MASEWILKKATERLILAAQEQALAPFSLIRDFRKQNTRGNISKISVNHTMLSTDRIEIHQSQPASMT